MMVNMLMKIIPRNSFQKSGNVRFCFLVFLGFFLRKNIIILNVIIF